MTQVNFCALIDQPRAPGALALIDIVILDHRLGERVGMLV